MSSRSSLHNLTTADSAELAVEHWSHGSGPRLVFVHGSLDDRQTWRPVVDLLADDFEVVTYDRRGHSDSTAPPGQGSVHEDVADAIAVAGMFCSEPCVVVGHSYGATVSLLAAVEAGAGAFSAAIGHEPPLFAALKNDPAHADAVAKIASAMTEAARLIEHGQEAAGVELFVDQVAFGPGAWATTFSQDHRRTMVANAATWLDQFRDPQRLALTAAQLATAPQPLVVTSGSESLPAFGASLDLVLRAAPEVTRVRIEGAGHAAPLTHPMELAEVIKDTARLIGY